MKPLVETREKKSQISRFVLVDRVDLSKLRCIKDTSWSTKESFDRWTRNENDEIRNLCTAPFSRFEKLENKNARNGPRANERNGAAL